MNKPIRVVLDTSAIVAFARTSIHVGEVMAEVWDESAAAGFPMLCLAEAIPSVDDIGQLHVLVNHHATVMLAPELGSWLTLGELRRDVERLDAASAVQSATDLSCCVLTAQPWLYEGLKYGGPVIKILDE